MYCKHCGDEFVTEEAVICVKCGAPKGKGNNYCQNCGNAVPTAAVVCMNCGVSVEEQAMVGAKSKLAAGLLGIFLGYLGVHNFYLGYNQKAVIQLVLTIIGLITSCLGIGAIIVIGTSIWGLVEGIMILAGNISVDGSGNKLKE